MSRFTMMYRAIKSQNMKPLVLFAISVSILVLRKPALAFSIDANSSRRVVAGVAVKRLSTSRCVILRKKHKNNEDQLKPLPINATPSIGIIHSIDLPCENNNDTAIDDYFMGLALKQAQYAWDKGEVPIGAIIVRECNDDDNLSLNNARETIEDSPVGNNTNPNNKTQKRTFQILSKAHNQVESNMDASAHAELLALRQGAINLQNWRYPPNSKLYTTMEPCPMCLASIQAFRIDNIVYGAPDKRLGAVGTHIDLLTMAKHPYHEIKSVVGGVMEDECGGIVINFFRERRKKKKKSNTDSNVKDNGEQNEVLVHTNEEPVKLRYRFANIFKASTRKIAGQVFRRKS